MKNDPLLKQPAAWVPLAMSLAALVFLLGYVAVFGVVRHEDEGTPARIFQLIMAAQLPVIAYFAVKWLPKRPGQSLFILALQVVAWITPFVVVIWLESL